MRTPWLVTGVALAATVAMVAPARADDVSSWIALIEKQPAGVDRATWKEQRREAARKLAAARDRRALPVFLQLAESETFDIIGEIAIEGLGALGDAQAAPTLERIAADASRDRTQRDLAKKALAKLGVKPTTGTTNGTTAPGPGAGAGEPVRPERGTTEGRAESKGPPAPGPSPSLAGTGAGTGDGEEGLVEPVEGVGAALLGAPSGALPAGAPVFADDVLAASESVTLSAGVASLSYDSVRDRLAFDLDAEGRYRRRLERERMAWGVDAGARVIAATVDPDGEDRSRVLIVDLDAVADVRFYGGPKLYGVGTAGVLGHTQYLGIEKADGMPLRDARFAADLQLGLGGGYGRILDVGPRLRLRQLEERLRAARALGRPIDDEVARRLQAAWWATRRDRTGYRQLAATVAILREAGVLLGEPLSSTTYELLEVLRDPSFDDRADGLDVQLVFGEGYLLREDEPELPEGRIEMVFLRGRYARNLGLASDVTAHLDARARILSPEDVPSPWRIAAGGGWRRFVHGDHGELLGGLDVGGQLVLSSDDVDEPGPDGEPQARDLGLAVGATVGWSATLNRASRLRVGADLQVNAGELFLGASLTASYGWLDAGFARSLPAGL